MGDKARARRHLARTGLPCVPGYDGEDQSNEKLIAEAGGIGLPLMVKAAAGGGGRGMRLVQDLDELPAALELARSEAESAFGSGALILERALLRPRHVEIQVFADAWDNVIHLGERDCSVQRRHQKVIEEAPCPVLSEALRARMGQTAVEVARSIGYRGAGTVEFLLDAQGDFHFLEMNTRLQVEHPVTELITGLDLVALQLRVAEGRPLGLSQDEVRFAGHAIEVRLYAEDPGQDFLPGTGRIALWKPGAGEGLRFDDALDSGQEVSPFYDPMLAKVSAWGETREIARRRLIAGLEATALFGPANNRDFLIQCLGREAFAAGETTTAFIAEEFGAAGPQRAVPSLEQVAVAAVLQFICDREAAFACATLVSPQLKNWTSAAELSTPYRYALGGREFDLRVAVKNDERYRVQHADGSLDIEVLARDDIEAVLCIGKGRHRVLYHCPGAGRLFVSMAGVSALYPNLLVIADGAEEGGGGRVVAPMHGRVIEVFASPGDTVKKGDRLAILEAMKMQTEIRAEVDGILKEVLIVADQQVGAEDLMMDIEVSETAGDGPRGGEK